MEIEDVSEFSYGERHTHYRKQYGLGSQEEINKLTAPEFNSRMQMATEATQQEMLDEIHVMLRELLKRTPLKPIYEPPV